jgi:hypothetical protein
MRKMNVFYASVAVCGAAVFVSVDHGRGKATVDSTPHPPLAKVSPSPALAGGVRVYLDPVTGKPSTPPRQGLPDPAAAAMFNSSHEGLVEVPGTSRAGGFKVEARGHFQSAASVKIGENGKPIIGCLAGTDHPTSSHATEGAFHP